MRHKVTGKRLSRHKGARNALRRTLVKQLFENERIRTTDAKAKAIRGQAEKLITLAKRGNAAEEDSQMVHARRLAASRLEDAEIVKKLFDDIAPR
ncbi:MAG: bL17 family ribosomal protein, partial [Anaerolineae bacterium]|nr:bL17 family ribosomal protein [Anaerolineae bacterium]